MLMSLVGAGGTGKTTLLRGLKDEMPNFFFTDGFSRPVREVVKKHKLTKEVNQDLISTLMLWATENYIDQDVFSARSLIDVIAYTRLFNGGSTEALEEALEKYKDRILFFYLPIEFEQEDDGIRYQGLQKQEDEALREVMDQFNIPKLTLSGTVVERKNQFFQHLLSFKKA